MTGKRSIRNRFLITLFCFIGGIAWNTENMYFNTVMYNSIYGDATQAAIVCALVLVPMFFLLKKGIDAVPEKTEVKSA